MSLWNRSKPLNQPPGYGRVDQTKPAKTDQATYGALVALRHARADRSKPLSAKKA